jgi:hypothetical protein
MNEGRTNPPDAGDLRTLLHLLNNHHATILAYAELLEVKAHDDAERTRATQIVSATLDAMTVTRSIRERLAANPPA